MANRTAISEHWRAGRVVTGTRAERVHRVIRVSGVRAPRHQDRLPDQRGRRTDGAPTMLEPLPEANAIVSTSFFKNITLACRSDRLCACDRPADEESAARSTIGLHAGGGCRHCRRRACCHRRGLRDTTGSTA